MEVQNTISDFGGLWAHLKSDTKPTRRETKLMWPEAKLILEFLGRHLPKQRLIRALTVLSDHRKRRFLRSRIPKYGSLNKGFTEDELVKFLNCVDDHKALLLFTFQAVLGLRISEAVQIHVKDINLKTRELKIHNVKCDRLDVLPIPPQLFEQTIKYISDWEDEIVRHEGYLFYSEFYPRNNKTPHIRTDYARVYFTKALNKAKLDETYAISTGSQPKLMHRLTTHSLRHYAITNFAKKNNGNVMLTSKFARHRKINTTMVYVYTQKEELYRSIDLLQDGTLEKIRKLQEIE
ncbi:site-specific integrase [Candidatus Micrarchaeota archaeon]|nr:site-specific integrase [Candidatus Micrarchaeota archaeon]